MHFKRRLLFPKFDSRYDTNFKVSCLCKNVCLLLVLAVLFSGCSIGTLKLYPGPKMPKDKLAFINNSLQGMHIRGLDGKEVKIGTWWEPGGGAKETGAVLPGKHTVKVTYSLYDGMRNVGSVIANLEANFEAGHYYTLGVDVFYIPDLNQNDCETLLHGAQLQLLVNDKEHAAINGDYCNANIPYFYDRTARQRASVIIHVGDHAILIDKSTLTRAQH
jgi:hypothetical protein